MVVLLSMEEKGKEERDKIGGDFGKGMIGAKPKRQPLSSWATMFILIAVVCVYIFYSCLRQNGILVIPAFSVERVAQRKLQCPDLDMSESEQHLVHYPSPVTYSREECSCTPVRFFAILSMQRSGSGWFETLLNSHENVSSNGEIFSVKERRSNVSMILDTLDRIYNLDWFSSAAKNECTAAVGLKWMLNQGLMQHHKEIVQYFHQRGVSAIFLFRRNLLRRFISILANEHDRDAKQLNGTHKAHVHSRAEADVLAQYKPKIDVSRLISELKRFDMLEKDALRSFNSTRHTLLYYEDLIVDQMKAMDVLDFLRVPRRKLTSRHVKIHTRSLQQQIENWDEVSNALKGTEFESFLTSRRRRRRR